MDKFGALAFDRQEPPKFKEVNNKKWILYGEDNKYPDYLISLFNSSPKHGAIIRAKARYISGNGWNLDKKITTLQVEAEVDKFINTPNPYETLQKVKQGIVLDNEIFNAFALEIIWSKTGGRIAEIYHVPAQRLRCNIDATEFYYTKDWNRYHPEDNKDFKSFPKFDLNNPKGSQILYVTNQGPKESGNQDVYAYPEYINGLAYIETDAEIANYHLNNIKNGFMASSMIEFYNGIPTEEEKKTIERQLKDKFTGTNNAGRFVLSFSESRDRASQVTKLQPDNFDKQFLQLNEAVQQEIFTVHNITSPMLFGIRVQGQLGGRNELLEAWQLFKINYVNPKQQEIDNVFNTLLEINKLPKCLSTAPINPVNLQVPDSLISTIITDNEARQSLELSPVDDPRADEVPSLRQQAPITQRKQFLSDKDLIEVFSKYGRPSNEWNVLKEKPLRFDRTGMAKPLQVDISTVEGKILEIISRDPSLTPEQISSELGIDVSTVKDHLSSLIDSGLLVESGGKLITPPEIPSTIDIIVAYKYDLAPGIDGPVIIPTSREFCKELVKLDRIYTRKEIQSISTEVGYDVWTKRGGFYTNPKTHETTEYCRHIWKQQVLIKR